MKKFALHPGHAAGIVLLLTAMTPAQTPGDASAPLAQPKTVIKSTTRLVVLDIVATDSQGAPVAGLETALAKQGRHAQV